MKLALWQVNSPHQIVPFLLALSYATSLEHSRHGFTDRNTEERVRTESLHSVPCVC